MVLGVVGALCVVVALGVVGALCVVVVLCVVVMLGVVRALAPAGRGAFLCCALLEPAWIPL